MNKAARAYFQTQVTTTSQENLVTMLYQAAIKCLEKAKINIEKNDVAQKGILISKALDIIAELDSSLNVEKGGELAENLHALYFYCKTKLLAANLKLDSSIIDEVIAILAKLCSAFDEINAQNDFEERMPQKTSIQS